MTLRGLIIDVDDCLLQTSHAHSLGVHAIESTAREWLHDSRAHALANSFDGIYHALLSRHHGNEPAECTSIIQAISFLQRSWPHSQYGVKLWSRELWLQVAADRTRIPLTGSQCTKLADAFWSAVETHAKLFPDVREAFDTLHAREIHVVLLTGSDARTRFNETTHTFEYDAEYSRSRKKQRLRLDTRFGLAYDALIVADPIDKPHTHAFEEALDVLREKKVKINEVGMVGDSRSSDLAPASLCGVQTLFLIRSPAPTLEEKNVLAVNDLREVLSPR